MSDTRPDSNSSFAVRAPDPQCVLAVLCVECGEVAELPLPIDQRALAFLLASLGWFISVLSAPKRGTQAPMVIGPLCAACAREVYPPEVFAAAEQKRQQLVQSLVQVSQAPQETR